MEWKQQPLLEVAQLTKSFSQKQNHLVLDGVSFTLQENEIVGLVGASGAGKSTIGRIIAGLESANSGQVLYDGQDLLRMSHKKRRALSKDIAMIFQDPYEFLSSTMTIEQIVMEPLIVQKISKNDRNHRIKLVQEALWEVSLEPKRYMSRYAHELSGGERQRVGLARAFVCRPRLIIADEPTSMLDTSLRLELLQLMKEMGRKYNISYMFVTHDLALTRGFCDRLLVLESGKIVEQGQTDTVIDHPQHSFTVSLIEALLQLEKY